jgi:hypothetical protein
MGAHGEDIGSARKKRLSLANVAYGRIPAVPFRSPNGSLAQRAATRRPLGERVKSTRCGPSVVRPDGRRREQARFLPWFDLVNRATVGTPTMDRGDLAPSESE